MERYHFERRIFRGQAEIQVSHGLRRANGSLDERPGKVSGGLFFQEGESTVVGISREGGRVSGMASLGAKEGKRRESGVK